jgi:hypothetical protein
MREQRRRRTLPAGLTVIKATPARASMVGGDGSGAKMRHREKETP